MSQAEDPLRRAPLLGGRDENNGPAAVPAIAIAVFIVACAAYIFVRLRRRGPAVRMYQMVDDASSDRAPPPAAEAEQKGWDEWASDDDDSVDEEDMADAFGSDVIMKFADAGESYRAVLAKQRRRAKPASDLLADEEDG